MAAGSSRVPYLIDWLVNAFQVPQIQVSPGAGLPLAPVVVYDGPAANNANEKLVLWVGITDPENLAGEPAATFTQARSDMGGLTRDEQSEIHCVAAAWSGTDDIRAARVAAFAITAAAEQVVRADTTQFGGSAQLAFPGVTAGELRQNTTQQGAVAWIPFSVIFKSFT